MCCFVFATVTGFFGLFTGHIMTGSFMGRRNLYIQLVKVLYCKLPSVGKQLPTFPHMVWGLKRRRQRWKASVLPLHHSGPAGFFGIPGVICLFFFLPNPHEEGKRGQKQPDPVTSQPVQTLGP